MFTRFSNPHAGLQSAQLVSRHELYTVEDVGHAEHTENASEAVAHLEHLLKRSLDASYSVLNPEKSNKRRKVVSKDVRGKSAETDIIRTLSAPLAQQASLTTTCLKPFDCFVPPLRDLSFSKLSPHLLSSASAPFLRNII